jgi:hypothetical protein
MIRDAMGDEAYWSSRIEADLASIANSNQRLSMPIANPVYEPQYLFDLAERHLRLMMRQYSRGDQVADIGRNFPDLIEAWERSNQKATEVCEEGIQSCRDWVFRLDNLNHYNWCFRLIGLALALNIQRALWDRLVKLIGGEGEDVLLDRVIGSRDTNRRVGEALLHSVPYSKLLDCIDAAPEVQPGLLKFFVENWYEGLKRPPQKKSKAGMIEPYWYSFGDPAKNPLSMGSYFGRWCTEAVGVVKAFSIDDSLCLGLEHYPGDLIHPRERTTSSGKTTEKRWFRKFFR